MFPTIGRRRLEMLGARVEAVCAAHKVSARAWRAWTRRGRVTLLVSTSPAYDLRRLKNEITLSLGVPVTVYRDAVICEVLP